MTTISEPNKPRRYYGDDCRVDPTLDLGELKQHVHAAYTHWVAKNFHLRDFVEAVEHSATMAYTTFVADGSPQLTGELPATVTPALAAPRKKSADTAAIRLYDELNSLSPEIDLNLLDRVLAGPFIRWLAEGWHARDFIQAAKDVAVVVVYDHELCRAFGGMGGGQTSEQFLSSAYRG